MLKCDADLFDLRALERDPHSAGSRHLGHEQLMILCYTGVSRPNMNTNNIWPHGDGVRTFRHIQLMLTLFIIINLLLLHTHKLTHIYYSQNSAFRSFHICISSCYHHNFIISAKLHISLANSELQNLHCTWIVAAHKSPLPPLASLPFFSRIRRIFILFQNQENFYSQIFHFLKIDNCKMLAALGQLQGMNDHVHLLSFASLLNQTIVVVFSCPEQLNR